MKTQEQILKMAELRLSESECLLTHGFYDAAYYMSGYVIEYLLKARICKTLGIPDIFDFGSPEKTKIKNEGNVLKAYKVHDLEQLVILSGIYNIFSADLINDNTFKIHWSWVSQWTEESRYKTGHVEQETKDFVNSIKEVRSWILKHL